MGHPGAQGVVGGLTPGNTDLTPEDVARLEGITYNRVLAEGSIHLPLYAEYLQFALLELREHYRNTALTRDALVGIEKVLYNTVVIANVLDLSLAETIVFLRTVDAQRGEQRIVGITTLLDQPTSVSSAMAGVG